MQLAPDGTNENIVTKMSYNMHAIIELLPGGGSKSHRPFVAV